MELTALSRLDGESVCGSRYGIALEVEVRRPSMPWWWDREDVGFDGCRLYRPWPVGDDGSLLLRIETDGVGIEYRGSYTVIFSRVG